MKVVYTGTADHRGISSSDFPSIDQDFEDIVWTPGSSAEVPDEVAEYLVEFNRHEFALFEDPKGRDHRTKDELLVEAGELGIPGRSSMNKEELLDAIYARRAEIEAEEASANPSSESASESSTESVPEEPYFTQEKADPV
jgi:hypothetical protein